MKGLRKARQKAKKEQDKQANMISCACFVVLWEDYGWRETRIMRRFVAAMEVMQECYDKYTTPLEMLEQETGIEMFLDGDKSYHEYMYLSKDVQARQLSEAEMIYMQNRTVKFAPMMVLSSLCIVLHREDKWGVEKISGFLYKIDLIRRLLGEDEEKYMEYMENRTGKNPKEMWGK